jgi:hypothetical protein
MQSMVNAHRAGSGGLAKLGEGARTTNDSRVSAGLSRGANLSKKLNAAPWSDTFPAAGSTLDLDFANNRGFVRGVGQGGVMDAITFTRASVGRFVGEDGLLQEAGIGEPRFDWASTEQVAQRNLVTFSNDISNAIWQVDFGGTVSKSGNTISFTAPSTDRRFALINNSFIPTIDGETYTLQARFEVSAGSEVIALGVRNAAAVFSWLAFNTATNSIVGTYSISTIATSIDLISATEVSPNVWDMAIAVVSNGRSYQPLIHFGSDGQSASDLRLNGNGSGSINLSRVQFELGDTPTTYQEVGSAVPSTTPLAANPTSNGLLIEEARTNRLFWNRDATQTEWVKTNVTASKDQTGIDGVANAASSLTATANDGTCIQTITLAAGNRTGSVFLKRITGTGNIQVTLDGSTYSTVELSDTLWYRIVLSGNVTNPTVGIRLAVSGDAVAMDYGQVEDGLFATSPILTTTATVTRSADTATIEEPNVVCFYNNGFLTWNMQFKGITNSTGVSFISVVGQGANAAATLNSYRAFISTARAIQSTLFNINGAGIGSNTFNEAYQQFLIINYIFSSNSSNCFSAFNNQSFTTGSVNNHGISTSLNRVRLFGNTANTNFSGYVKRLTYVPKFITDIAGQDWSAK